MKANGDGGETSTPVPLGDDAPEPAGAPAGAPAGGTATPVPDGATTGVVPLVFGKGAALEE